MTKYNSLVTYELLEMKLLIARHGSSIDKREKVFLINLLSDYINTMVTEFHHLTGGDEVHEYLVKKIAMNMCIINAKICGQAKLSYFKFTTYISNKWDINEVEDKINILNKYLKFSYKELVCLVVYTMRLCCEDDYEVLYKLYDDRDYILLGLIILERKMYLHDMPHWNSTYAKRLGFNNIKVNRIELKLLQLLRLYITGKEYSTATHLRLLLI